MQISQNLKLKQSQSLVMTPQLQQAIKLLQLNNLELTELVNKELEELLPAIKSKAMKAAATNGAAANGLSFSRCRGDIDGLWR